MKKIIILSVLSFLMSAVIAQVPADRTVYNCANNSKNIYATLAIRKSVIIVHKGVDCSICRNAVSTWQVWAAANTTNVEVRGAIT